MKIRLDEYKYMNVEYPGSRKKKKRNKEKKGNSFSMHEMGKK